MKAVRKLIAALPRVTLKLPTGWDVTENAFIQPLRADGDQIFRHGQWFYSARPVNYHIADAVAQSGWWGVRIAS